MGDTVQENSVRKSETRGECWTLSSYCSIGHAATSGTSIKAGFPGNEKAVERN